MTTYTREEPTQFYSRFCPNDLRALAKYFHKKADAYEMRDFSTIGEWSNSYSALADAAGLLNQYAEHLEGLNNE